MASSAHIQRAKAGSIAHNSRENFSQSVVFQDEKNEISCSSKEAFSLYRKELRKRSQAYTDRVGQKVQKDAITQLSAVVNLQQHHTLKDLQPIIDYYEKTLDTKVFQSVIHRDEGKLVLKEDESVFLTSGQDFFKNPDDEKLYFDKKFTQEIDISKYEIVKNYHAHIEMMGMDSTGAGIKRNRLHTYYLSNMQTEVSQFLGIERGINYAKEGKKAPKRLDVLEYKRENTKKQKGYVTQAEVKKQIELLRNEMREAKAFKKEDYAELSALRKKLLAAAKAKDLNAKQLQEQISAQRKTIFQKIDRELEQKEKQIDIAVGKFKEIAPESENILQAVEYVRSLEKENAELKNQEPEEKIVEVPVVKEVEVEKIVEVENPKTAKELSQALESIKSLETENYTLKQDFSSYKQGYADLVTQNKELQESETKLQENAAAFIKKEIDIDTSKDSTVVQIIKKLVAEVKELSRKLTEALTKNEELEKDIAIYKPIFDAEQEKLKESVHAYTAEQKEKLKKMIEERPEHFRSSNITREDLREATEMNKTKTKDQGLSL